MPGNNTKSIAVTILIVDDDSFICDMVRAHLALQGYQVFTACSGAEAIQKTEETKKIDILLTDIMMPRMNGVELAKKFVNLIPRVKILFMSGYLNEPVRDEALPLEKYPVLEKPFSLDRLKSEFTRVLANQPAVFS
jgi:CheY-like chemotaxis protein